MAHKDKVYFIRVPEATYKTIGVLADADDRSINKMANIVMEKGLATFGVPQKTGVPPKIEDVKTFVKQGQNAQEAAEKIISEANASGVSAELPCCMNELQPCKHWVWDTASGEGYRNVLSGRFLEVE